MWCKNWYEPVDNRMDIIAQAQKILTLDEYLSCNNPIAISLNYYIDDLVNDGVIKPIRLTMWNEEIVKYMSMYNVIITSHYYTELEISLLLNVQNYH